jgi:uncharacterized protein
MEFEWDEAKNSANVQKHGIAFSKAVAVFADDRRRVVEDERYRYDEPRFQVFGLIEGRLHVVIIAMRGETVRIISARRANKREQKKHGHRSL